MTRRLPGVLAVLLVLSPAGLLAAPSRDLGDYVLLAVDDLFARTFAVQRGDVGVSDARGRLELRGSFEGPVSTLVAADARLHRPGRCRGLFAGTLLGASCQEDGAVQPFAGPLFGQTGDRGAGVAAACGFPAELGCDPSRPLVVADDATARLDPGGYGAIEVRRGTLVLRGDGRYAFCQLVVGRRARVVVDGGGPATVTVAGDVVVGSNGRLGPLDLLARGPTVRLQRRAFFQGTLCAPYARVDVASAVQLGGRLVGQRLKIGKSVLATVDVGGGATTTTTPPASTTTSTVAPVCGNGRLEAGEACDGSAFGAFTCGDGACRRCTPACTAECTTCQSTTTVTTAPPASPTTTTLPRGTCGDGVVDAGEECDGSAFGTFACEGGACRHCTAACTAACGACPAETCGDCVDNDGNGLVDLEDPACCTVANARGTRIRRGVIRKRGARFGLVARLARKGFRGVRPRRQDLLLQVGEVGGDQVLCARLPASRFKKRGRTFVFTDRKGRVAGAKGLRKVVVTLSKRGGAALRASGRRVDLAPPDRSPLRVSVGFLEAAPATSVNRCTARVQKLRSKKGRLRFP